MKNMFWNDFHEIYVGTKSLTEILVYNKASMNILQLNLPFCPNLDITGLLSYH